MNSKTRLWEIAIALSVKTYDIDFAGIVSNIVYIRWLEDMRLKMLETYFPLEKLLAKNYCPVLASTQIDYKKALGLGDKPTGKMWMSEMGLLRCNLQAEIYVQKQLAATATQTAFFINLETMRPLKIPVEMKAAYRANTVFNL